MGLRNIDKLERWSTNAIARVLRHKVVSDFLKVKVCYVVVRRRKMTGLSTEEQMVSVAIAFLNGHLQGYLYAGATRLEAMATVKCKHMDSFKMLTVLYCFSTAVRGMAASTNAGAPRRTGLAGHDRGGVLSSSDDRDAAVHQLRFSSQTKSTTPNSGHFQEPVTGSKAANAACRAGMQQQRELVAFQSESAARKNAIQTLAGTAQERTSILLWTSAEASNSPNTADLWKAAIAAHREDTNVLCDRSNSAHARAGGARAREGEDNSTKGKQGPPDKFVAVENAIDKTREVFDMAASEEEQEGTFTSHEANDASVSIPILVPGPTPTHFVSPATLSILVRAPADCRQPKPSPPQTPPTPFPRPPKLPSPSSTALVTANVVRCPRQRPNSRAWPC